MIPAIGHLTLIFSFLTALALIGLPLLFRFGSNKQALGVGYMMVLVQFITLTSAFGILIYCHIVSDFSVVNVVENSHSSKPMLYKISGVWGNHEGSMLLFAWLLMLVTTLFACLSPAETMQKAGALAVQAVLSAGFLGFILFTSNPFERVFPAAREGLGLNPLLQDIGLALHPPCLYIGYVGFSLGFSLSIVALLQGKVDREFARILKPWVLFSWSFLTIGIALGSWWAYRELGWGGFWFWDPVENASLMPWLTGTALLHSLIVLEKRQQLPGWTLLLAMTTFSLSLLGAFLVRSGVLTSVHSFANDPARGFFILMFLTGVVGISLILFALRAPRLKTAGGFGAISRESGILINNLLLLSATATILLGTLYPIFYELLAGGKLSIGAPYFASTFIPITLPLLGLAAVGSLLKWKNDRLQFTKHGMLALPGLAAFFFLGSIGVLTAATIWLASWLILSQLKELIKRKKAPAEFYAMILAHIGLAVLALGVGLAVEGFREKEQLMQAGGKLTIADYRVVFNGVTYAQGPNYMLRKGMLYVETEAGNEVTHLAPEVRFYPVEKSQTTESAVYTHWFTDIYAAMGDTDEQGKTVIRLYYRPFISLIWIGAALMALGGIVGLFRRRKNNA